MLLLPGVAFPYEERSCWSVPRLLRALSSKLLAAGDNISALALGLGLPKRVGCELGPPGVLLNGAGDATPYGELNRGVGVVPPIDSRYWASAEADGEANTLARNEEPALKLLDAFSDNF